MNVLVLFRVITQRHFKCVCFMKTEEGLFSNRISFTQISSILVSMVMSLHLSRTWQDFSSLIVSAGSGTESCDRVKNFRALQF
ncbi:hypothetical protein PGIGA_G00250970 [Pangasianodon gigas]|uniref:Uncharacterized protein n=1 Tax=Pangasianodon gigas TaxID=30993 RepID=A0ACC5WQR0_PANGG|nr:hypothetical protein [Pangasianodon gigas]